MLGFPIQQKNKTLISLFEFTSVDSIKHIKRTTKMKTEIKREIKIETLENLFGTKKELLERKRELQRDIIELTRQERRKSIMICSHNTILATGIDDKITHIVDQDVAGCLVMIHQVDKHLSVPRYEPKTAKAWMKEETKFNNEFLKDDEMPNYTQHMIGERELRSLVLDDRRKALGYNNMHIALYKEAT